MVIPRYFLIALFIFFISLKFPAVVFAQDDSNGVKISSVGIGLFDDHYETPDALQTHLTVVGIRGNIQLDRLWRLELRHFRGSSSVVNGFQASIGDFEARVAHYLGDPKESLLGDSPGRNLYGWASWRVWTSHQQLNNVVLDPERDEGLGFGITRDPKPEGLSYFYTFGLYPSVRTSLAKQANAFNIEAGGSYQIANKVYMSLGYRFQAIRTDAHHARGQEQGLTFGFRALF